MPIERPVSTLLLRYGMNNPIMLRLLVRGLVLASLVLMAGPLGVWPYLGLRLNAGRIGPRTRPTARGDDAKPDDTTLKLLPRAFVERYRVVPLRSAPMRNVGRRRLCEISGLWDMFFFPSW